MPIFLLVKTPIFCLHLSAERQEEIYFIFRCVGFCGDLRRILRGFHVSAGPCCISGHCQKRNFWVELYTPYTAFLEQEIDVS